MANLSDLAFSFDGFKLLADRAWVFKKNILVKGVGSAKFPVEGLRLGKVRLLQRL
ncbi:hypothetical protein [Saccharolobus caldissimus]|uniref:hypothetical protein n=1 Tax=Saccharolobus caldissimus TaxID=1702097 RepID=UPI001E408501|nr:hypothetical protein [Saccharolobus caldissimus]